MNDYLAYGMKISSQIPLPELVLRTDQKPADVTIRLGDVPNCHGVKIGKRGNWDVAQGKFWLSVNSVASYYVSDGCEIWIDPEPGSSDADIRTFLFGSTLAALLHQREILALHASAIQTQRGAVIFGNIRQWQIYLNDYADAAGLPDAGR